MMSLTTSQVGRCERPRSLLRRRGNEHGEPLHLEVDLEKLEDDRVVVDHEDGAVRHCRRC